MLNKPPPTATLEERSFFNRIEYLFGENNNVISYFEPDIGGLRPDFILLLPKFGVIIAEIKDYSPNNLINIHKSGKWEKLDKFCNFEELGNNIKAFFKKKFFFILLRSKA